MTTPTNPNRRPAGTPVGGQFAPTRRAESTATLDVDDTPRAGLGDVSNIREGSRTPWGAAQWVKHVAPGAVQVSTAGHGGIKLSPERNRMVPAPLRKPSGWYEEDCEAGIVAWFHPDACPQTGRSAEDVAESGRRTALDWFPDGYEAVTGETIAAGESYMRDNALWDAAHADDEVAVSAGRSETFPGMVEVTVARGGTGTKRTLLVPAADYNDKANRHPLGKCGGRFVPPADSRYEELAPPVRPPRPARARYKNIVTSGLTPAQQQRAQSDLAARVSCPDGKIRTVEEIVRSGGIVGKAATGADERGRRSYYLSYAAEPEGADGGDITHALIVSKAAWDAVGAPAD